ncbi:MAG: response regulator transcription factor [Patescibacteria group bacterium]|nr:response regulator transcription factor [Patescibacteria group bacterium]
MRILLIEDEKEIANFVVNGLRAERFAVDWADSAEKGLAWARLSSYDLGIFDVKLQGGITGIEACRRLRERGIGFPIIILSVMNDAITKVKALNLGADDYLQKPFFMAELIARVRALLRREKKTENPVFKVADLILDTIKHTVIRGDKPIKLNRKEFSLLEYFMRNQGITLTRAMILEHVWDANADPFTNTVDVHIRFLRQKIDDGFKEKLIKTVHGYGYKLEAKPDGPQTAGTGKRQTAKP